MFGKKLVLIAAAVALATGSVAATSESAHVKVEVATVHGHKQAVVRAHAHAVKQVSETAPPSNEDSEDDDSTDEDSTEKDDDSTEDEELDIEVLAGSDAGSNSSSVIEFCLDGWTEVSVDGVDSLFCVEGTPCTDSKEGECPAAQEGLEYGSYCAVKEGGKGCKPKTKEMWEKEQDEDSEDSEEGSNDDSEENSEDDSSAAEDDEDSSADDDEEDSEEDSSAADEEDESEESEDAPATKKSHHKKSHKKDACAAGQSPMSVEGVEGVFCVSGQSCVAEIKGACPGPQANLQYGAYCDRVKTGVMGCKPKTKEMWEAEQKGGNTGGQCNGAGQSPMSVEGVEGIFCVSGQACVANIDGACPGPQAGLPYGSSCGIVKTGVKGCKPNAAPKKHHKKSHHKKSHKKDACAAGQSPMSVEGVEGVFCVSGQSCVAEIKGACPGPQANLQYGAYCDRVKTGVMGCKPKTKEMWEAEQKGGNTGGQCNGAGQSPMSVEGVEGIFCVSGQACVANIDGACPGPQAGLPYGSSCGIVKTGVKGCKPNAAPKKHHKKSHKKLRVVKKHSKN